MNLEQLVAKGAYVNAGYLDFFDELASRHRRLGQVTAGGDLVLSEEGEMFVRLHATLDPETGLVVVDPAEEEARRLAEEQAAAERLAAENALAQLQANSQELEQAV